MKRAALVLAIVFTVGMSYASAGTLKAQKASTEQSSTNSPDEKKKDGCSKSCDKAKSGEKKSTSDKK
ncbi:MAG: hypothetical protein AAGU19_03215 [Prolixibacteraceae bacterium]